MSILRQVEDYITRMRELEDEDVRKAIRDNYGPLLRVNNTFSRIDGGWIYVSVLHGIIFILFVFSYIYLFFITCYLVQDDFVLLGVQFHYLLLAFFGASFVVHLLGCRPDVNQIHKIIGQGFFKYTNDHLWSKEQDEFKKEMRKEQLQLIPFLGLIGVIGLFIVVLGPLIDNMLGVGYTDDYYNGVYMKTPIPMYFPFEIDSMVKHHLATSFQMITVLMLALGIIGVVFIYIVTTQHMALQLKILNTSLGKLNKRIRMILKSRYPKHAIQREDITKDEKYQECVTFCLKENIKHHQMIKQFQRRLAPLVGVPLLAAFLMGTMIMALSLMILVKRGERIGLLMTNTIAMIGEVANLYIACSFGEDILTLSSELFDKVYFIEWNTKMNVKNRKIVLSFQGATKDPITLGAALFFSCSMATFSSICNSAYSYFSMLTATADQTAEN
uniref:Odorant receptor n=1 Tax=Cyrtorhinus lividipennis TaxID=1032904 RepID=A0A346TI18_9HEMI|nr:odorant receptor 10 [Cyrtorhinus lividipennis]